MTGSAPAATALAAAASGSATTSAKRTDARLPSDAGPSAFNYLRREGRDICLLCRTVRPRERIVHHVRPNTSATARIGRRGWLAKSRVSQQTKDLASAGDAGAGAATVAATSLYAPCLATLWLVCGAACPDCACWILPGASGPLARAPHAVAAPPRVHRHPADASAISGGQRPPG